MESFDGLVDQGMFPIWDISVLPKSPHDILMATDLILDRLWEEHASTTPCYLVYHLFFHFGVVVMYISIFINTLMYKNV
jgi:hypothetical protein